MQYFYITGASSGLGKAIAEILLEKDENIVIGISRHQTINHPNYLHFNIDLSEIKKVEAFQFGEHTTAQKITLINNAGETGQIKYTGDLEIENMITTYNLNLITPHILSNKFISTYQNHRAEKLIINVTSGAASSAYDGWSIYCASKAGLDLMSQCIDKEQSLLKNNFKIFSIAPNVMDTNMQEQIRNTNVKSFSRKDKFINLYESNKLYNPTDVAKKYLEFIDHPNSFKKVIYRIEL